MAENDKSTQNFALGLIVAAIIYLILRCEWGRFFGRRDSSGYSGDDSVIDGGTGWSGGGNGAGKDAGCGCGGCPTTGVNLPINPGISPGVILDIGKEKYTYVSVPGR